MNAAVMLADRQHALETNEGINIKNMMAPERSDNAIFMSSTTHANRRKMSWQAAIICVTLAPTPCTSYRPRML